VFDVYCASTRLIKVMPFTEINGVKLDGISLIKTATEGGEILANIENIFILIHALTFYLFQYPTIDDWTNISNGNDTFVPTDIGRYYMPLKNGDETRTFYFFQNGSSPLRFITCNSQEFQATIFRTPLLTTDFNGDFFRYNPNATGKAKDIKMFAVLIEKTYMSIAKDNLTKNVTTLEFSDIYDVRDLMFRINCGTNKQEAGNEPYSYVQKVKQSSTEQHDETKTDTYDDEGNPTGTEVVKEDTSIENFSFVQVITFEFYFPAYNDPTSACCETFANADTMSFYFTFTNNKGDSFILEPCEAPKILLRTYDENGKPVENNEDYVPPRRHDNIHDIDMDDKVVQLKVRWTQEMGIIADYDWSYGARCEVTAKKTDGFTYRLNEFTIKAEENIPYDPETKTSKEGEKWAAGEKKELTITIK
jgi:hypothetical protein